MNNKPILGILIGDATGVGPELTAKLVVSGFLTEHCRPILIGDIRIFNRGLSFINETYNCQVVTDIDQIDWNKNEIPFLDLKDQNPDELPIKKVSALAGKSVNAQLKMACQFCLDGKIEGFTFAPFNKSAMIEGGCKFESEHHLIANIFGVTTPFGEINMLGDLMTSRTTSHIPISAVSQNLNSNKILGVIELLQTTIANSGVAKPRIAVCGLNPHNGEEGKCGREEIDIIEPAVKMAQEKGIEATGPYPADILFIKAFRGEFDGAVTMYHDQGQIALKLKGFDQGITVAGGQPYPIATAAHGTAYDITGTGVVNTGAYENAIKMTAKMANHKRSQG